MGGEEVALQVFTARLVDGSGLLRLRLRGLRGVTGADAWRERGREQASAAA